MSDEVSSFMFWEGAVWLWYLWTIWENIWPHLFLSIIIIVYLKLYRSLYIVLKNVDLAFVNKQKRSGCYKMVVSAETYVCIHFKYTIYFWQQEVKKMLSRVCLVPKVSSIIRKYLKLTGVAFSFPWEYFPLLQEFTIFLWKQLFRLQVSPVLFAPFVVGPTNGIQPKLQGCTSSLYFALYKVEKHCQMKK